MNVPKIIEYIVTWLDDYGKNAGTGGFVVGVSGGIDSAVTSTLCAKTGQAVLALNMPIYQAPDQESLSQQHITWLQKNHANVTGIRTDLSPVFDAFRQTLPPAVQDDLTMANTRSRLRMVTLYAFASHHKMLVAGTGNKVEDYGWGFSPNTATAEWIFRPSPICPKPKCTPSARLWASIQPSWMRPPTDGLWADNRTDEAQMGATYGEFEWAMGYEENPAGAGAPNQRQETVLGIYRQFHRINRHKMEPIPVCKIPIRFR